MPRTMQPKQGLTRGSYSYTASALTALAFVLFVLLPALNLGTFPLNAEPVAEKSIIKRIMLIDKPGRPSRAPLSPIVKIGIELKKKAYYTFLKDQKDKPVTVSSGFFNKGQNFITLDLAERFQKTGSLATYYTLKLKAGKTITNKTIIIGVNIEEENKKKEKSPAYYEISMVIGNHTVHHLTKTVNRLDQLRAITKKAPYLVEHHPAYAPGENPEKYRASINPLAAAFLAGKLIARKIKKDRLKRMKYRHTRHMKGIYTLPDKDVTRTVAVMLWTK